MHKNTIIYVVNSDWFFLSHRLPLAIEAMNRGYHVLLVSKNTGKRAEIESYGIGFIDVDFDSSSKNPFKDFKLIWSLGHIYNQHNPVIIHHVTIKPVLYGSIAARFFAQTKPMVVNAVAGLGYVFTDNTRYVMRTLVKGLMNIAFKYKSIKFIFQNEDDRDFYMQLGYVHSGNHIIIKGSGVNEQLFAYQQPEIKSKIRVLFSGRMLLDKGVREFLKAAIILKEKWQGRVEFVLVGATDANNPSTMHESELFGIHIPGYLTWLGHMENMYEQCIKADIVCLPSYREGLPKSLVEAMAVGRPIVTTDTAGCRSCVDDGVNGFLVPVKSTKELADAIDHLLSNAELRLRMGEASRAKMLRELTLDKVLYQTFHFYQLPEVTPTKVKITIITVLLNNKDFIAQAIESVLSQRLVNVEYIVIDGGSDDGSKEIINRYASKITHVISEPDEGMYFAMNKGIELATGEVIGFLHADDFYAGPNVLRQVLSVFENETIDAVYADLDYVHRKSQDKVLRKWRSGKYYPNSFYKGWMPPHPTFFARKNAYQRFGGFNTELRSAADYELMLRFLLVYQARVFYIPQVWVKMRIGGQSNRNLQNRYKANREDLKAWEVNHLKPRWYTLLLKPLSKIFQYRF